MWSGESRGNVYNDWGNFNFTFISKIKMTFLILRFTIPILSALNKLGQTPVLGKKRPCN